MFALMLLELIMPVTCWPTVVELEADAAFRLLRFEVGGFGMPELPTMLLLIVFAPSVTWIPASEGEIGPFTVIDPMVLLAIDMVLLLEEPIPKLVPPAPKVEMETEPVPELLPIIFPVSVPMFAEPVCVYIPHHTPGRTLALLELVQTMLVMVFPCTLLGNVVLIARRIP